jgi:hypothetical protein
MRGWIEGSGQFEGFSAKLGGSVVDSFSFDLRNNP